MFLEHPHKKLLICCNIAVMLVKLNEGKKTGAYVSPVGLKLLHVHVSDSQSVFKAEPV